jgi:ankyrin repeat protein
MSFHTFCKAEPTFPESQENWEKKGDLNEDGNNNFEDINKTLTDISGYFEEHASPTDGNCFYHSIVDYIEGNDNELTKTIFETQEYIDAYDTNSVNFKEVYMFNMHWLRELVWKESLKPLNNEQKGASEETIEFRNRLKEGVDQTISDKNVYYDERGNVDRTKSYGHVGIDLWTMDREIDVTARLLGIDICTLQTIGEELKWVVSLHDPNNAKLDGLVCFLKNNGDHFTNLTFKGNTARMDQLRQRLRADRQKRTAAKTEEKGTPYLSEDLTNTSIKDLKKLIIDYNKKKSKGKRISGHSKLDQSGLVKKIVESGMMKKRPPPRSDKKQTNTKSSTVPEKVNNNHNNKDFDDMTKGELKSWIKKYNSDKHVWQKITRFLSMDKQGLKDRIRKQILLDKDETVFDMGRLDTMSKSELESWAEHNIYGKKVSILWQMEKLFRLTKEKIIKFLKEITPLDSKQELYIACFRGQAEVVQLLLSDPNIQINEILINRVGPTRPKSVIKVVTNRQNKFISRKETTTTVSSDICGTPLYIACKKGHTNIVQLLLTRKDILINKTDPHNILRPPLYIACEEGHTDIVQLLLTRKDINVNLHDHFFHGPLYIACEKGHTDIVQLLLTRKDINVNLQDPFYHGPLYIACDKGHTDIVRLLLDRPEIKINIKQSSHFLHGSPFLYGEPYIADELYIAREKGHTDIVRLLLDRPEIKIEMAEIKIDIDSNQTMNNGQTPLTMACRDGYVNVVRLLLARYDVGVNKADIRGRTPLYAACDHEDESKAELARRTQIHQEKLAMQDMEAVNRFAPFSLWQLLKKENTSFWRGWLDGQRVGVLVKMSWVKSITAYKALSSVLQYHEKISIGEFSQIFNEIKVDFDETSGTFSTPRAQKSHVATLKTQIRIENFHREGTGEPVIHMNNLKRALYTFLMKYTKTPEDRREKLKSIQRNSEGLSLLGIDPFGTIDTIDPIDPVNPINHVEVVRLLLARKDIQINQATNDGATPLYIACVRGKVEIVRLLLDRDDIGVNQAMNDGQTPLYAACRNGNVKVINALLTRKEIKINQAKDNGATPLIISCWNDRVKIVNLLLARKEIHINQAMNNGATPLYMACRNDSVKVVNSLLTRKDIDINQAKNNGETPLYITCEKGHVDVVRLLLARKDIQINQADEDGGTPLWIAQENKHTKIVSILEDKIK